MAFKDYFSRQAADYATYRPHYPSVLFSWLAEQCDRHGCAWDCATGNGQAAIALAPYFQQVIATDGSAAQINQATVHPQVTYRIAVAEDSQLGAQTIDLVTVAQAAHWFNLKEFYQEVRRVLRPEGTIAIWCYGMFTLDEPRVNDILQNYYRHTLAPFWPAGRRIVESGYRGIPFPFDEYSAPPFFMQVEWTLSEMLGYLFTWSGTQRYIAARQVNPLEDLAAALSVPWGTGARVIRWPLSLRIGKV